MLLLCVTFCRAAGPGDFGLPVGPEGLGEEQRLSGPTIDQLSITAEPAISEASRATHPGETLVIMGVGLEGARLRVWVGDQQFDLDALKGADDRMFVVVPNELPDGKPVPLSTMLVWPTRAGRTGEPIRINAADAWWAWPVRLRADSPGQRVRLFGANLSLPQADARVVLEPPASVGPVIELPVTGSEPFCLDATIPDSLSPGSYKLWAHNGTGGAFGWSGSVQIDVVQKRRAPDAVFRVDDYPGTDTQKIRAACKSARAAGGGILQLSDRTYLLEEMVHIHGEVPIVVRGAGMGQWDNQAQSFLGPGTLVIDQTSTDGDVVWLLSADGAEMHDLTLVSDHAGGSRRHTVRLAGSDQFLKNVRVVNRGPTPIACISVIQPGLAGITLDGCDLHTNRMGVIVNAGTHGVRITDTKVRGYFSAGRGTEADAFVNMGSSRFIVEHCEVTSHARTRGKALSRTCLLYDSGIRDCYLAHNRSIDVGPDPSVEGMARNVGEQYLFHQRGPLGGVYRVVDAGPDWVTLNADVPRMTSGQEDEWVVFIAKGRGLGQYRPVIGGLGDRVELEYPWRVMPDADSVVIIQRAFRRNIVYDNFIDPRPDGSNWPANYKTAGVYFYLGAFNNIVAGNRINHTAVGVGFACDTELPNGWNLVRDNTLSNLRGWAGGAAYIPMFYNEHSRGLDPNGIEAQTHVTSIGNIYRGNTAAGGRAAASVGWLRYNEVRDSQYIPSSDHGITLSVIENNGFLGVDRGVLLSAPASWTLLRANTFGFTTPMGRPAHIYRPNRVPEPLVIDNEEEDR